MKNWNNFKKHFPPLNNISHLCSMGTKTKINEEKVDRGKVFTSTNLKINPQMTWMFYWIEMVKLIESVWDITAVIKYWFYSFATLERKLYLIQLSCHLHTWKCLTEIFGSRNKNIFNNLNQISTLQSLRVREISSPYWAVQSILIQVTGAE